MLDQWWHYGHISDKTPYRYHGESPKGSNSEMEPARSLTSILEGADDQDSVWSPSRLTAGLFKKSNHRDRTAPKRIHPRGVTMKIQERSPPTNVKIPRRPSPLNVVAESLWTLYHKYPMESPMGEGACYMHLWHISQNLQSGRSWLSDSLIICPQQVTLQFQWQSMHWSTTTWCLNQSLGNSMRAVMLRTCSR